MRASYTVMWLCLPWALASVYCFDVFSFPCKSLSIITKPIGCYDTPWFHPAVMRSVVDGLQKIGAPFNVNPSSVAGLGEVVWVLNNESALSQCVALKKNRIIKALLAGPNFVILPHENNRILLNPLIDGVILPSTAIKHIYIQDEPDLSSHTYVCCTGVDIAVWQPDQGACDSKTVLLYWKTEPLEFCQAVQQLLEAKGWNVILIRYGEYTPETYKAALNKSRFAVFISYVESQGIALAEAWAMNVPTLAWNPWKHEYKGKFYPLPSCPYLNPMVGQEWYSLEELELLLKDMERRLQWYNPRAWVLDNMSDEASAYTLMAIIDRIINKK